MSAPKLQRDHAAGFMQLYTALLSRKADAYTENGVSKTATAALTVTNPQLLSFEITPTDPTVSLLSPNQAFVATAIYADYSTANVTTAAAWSSWRTSGPAG